MSQIHFFSDACVHSKIIDNSTHSFTDVQSVTSRKSYDVVICPVYEVSWLGTEHALWLLSVRSCDGSVISEGVTCSVLCLLIGSQQLASVCRLNRWSSFSRSVRVRAEPGFSTW